MASVECYNITKNSVTVRLIDMSPDYTGNTRILWWRHRESTGSYPTQADNYPNDGITLVNGSTTSDGYTYNNLKAGTLYYFKAYVTPDGGTTVWTFENSCTTLAASTPTLTITDTQTTSITVQLTGVDQDTSSSRSCSWKYKLASNTTSWSNISVTAWTTLSAGISQTQYTFSGLTPGTQYSFLASYQQTNGGTYTSISINGITVSPTARIIICGFTTSSITLRVIDATAGTWKWYWRLNGGTYAQYDATTVTSNGGKSAAITKSNLSFGGTGNLISYDFKVVYNGLSTTADEITNITCAPSSGDLVRNFTHQTWNLMVDSVNVYRGPANWKTTTGYTLTAAQTKMPNSPPYTLTAARFNQLWYNLQQLRTGMANDFPVATNSSTSGAGSEYHVFAYRFYDASEWCLNDGLEKMQSG